LRDLSPVRGVPYPLFRCDVPLTRPSLPRGEAFFVLGARGMTFTSTSRRHGAAHRQQPSSRNGGSRIGRPQRLVGGAALGCVALACAWTLCANLAGDDTGLTDIVGSRGDKLVVRKPLPPASNSYARLFDPHPALGSATATFAPVSPAVQQATAAPSRPATQTAQDIASTPPPGLRLPQIRRVASAPADQPTIFEKLFGGPSPLTLAYAAPDDRGILADRQSTAGRYDRSTAVYDISARTVYMPDGSRLEAHSGFGSLLDDPRHADAKDRGVTPPNVYDLELRESPFHGVHALRLIPEDDGKVFGRSGLLAHSFMLGPNGDSNGCVSFRNYDAFLKAYVNGEIKRLAVVSRLE